MQVAAYKMLRKYRKQLQSFGIDYDRIPVPKEETAKAQPFRCMSRYEDTILVQFDYDPELVEEIKTFPRQTRRYDSQTKTWKISPKFDIVEHLIDYAVQYDFDVEAGVKSLLTVIIEDHQVMLEGSHAESSDFVVEELGGELRPFQRAGVQYAVKAERTFIADDVGLGKTIESLATIHFLNAFPALVVCMATVKYNWALETLKWLPDRRVGLIKGREFYRAQMANRRVYLEKDAHNLPGAYDVIIMNYDILKPQPNLWKCIKEYTNIKGHTFEVGDIIPEPLAGFKRDTKVLVKQHFKQAGYGKSKNGLIEKLLNINLKAFIIDESQKAKNNKSQRTQGCLQVSKDAPIRLALTGTPILSRPSELISQLNILDRLNDMGGFWHFAEHFCAGHHGRWGLDLSGAQNLEEMNQKLRGLCYIRRTKSQVLSELPPIQRSDIFLDLDNRENYDKAHADLVAWLKENARVEEEFIDSIQNLPEDEQQQQIADYRMSAAARAQRALQLTRVEHLKQIAAQGKLAMSIEWIRDFLETEEKLVVFAHHIEIQKSLIVAFEGCAKILGEDNVEIRQINIDRFQNDEDCRLIVCSLMVGGVGITLTAASNVAILEMGGWTPADYDQPIGRLHRIGQENSVMVWYLLGQDCIDIDIQDLINAKREVVDAATEGDVAEAVQSSILNDLIDRLIK